MRTCAINSQTFPSLFSFSFFLIQRGKYENFRRSKSFYSYTRRTRIILSNFAGVFIVFLLFVPRKNQTRVRAQYFNTRIVMSFYIYYYLQDVFFPPHSYWNYSVFFSSIFQFYFQKYFFSVHQSIIREYAAINLVLVVVRRFRKIISVDITISMSKFLRLISKRGKNKIEYYTKKIFSENTVTTSKTFSTNLFSYTSTRSMGVSNLTTRKTTPKWL